MNKIFSNKKDEIVECLIEDYRLDLSISSYLSIPSNATFLPIKIEYNTNNNRVKLHRDVGIQTYFEKEAPPPAHKDCLLDIKKKEFFIKEIIVKIKSNNQTNYQFFSNILSEFIKLAEKLSEVSLGHIYRIFNNKPPTLDFLKKLCNTDNDILDIFLRENDCIELENLINKISLISQTNLKKEVRFEQYKPTNDGRKKSLLQNFRRIVKFVIINREWLKALEKDKNDVEREKLLFEYNKLENPLDFINCKKLQLLFNKEEFRAKKNLNNLISDFHKQILSRQQHKRSQEEIEILVDLIKSIPILNKFPTHVLNHIAKLIRIASFDKGREIVREGHVSTSFYYIINGNCDVLSIGNDGLLKIDELHAGDTFGENSFNKNNKSSKLTPQTIITSSLTEFLIIEPSDINDYLVKQRLIEIDLIKSFISNWWPFKYWGWFDKEIEKFSHTAEFLRFVKGDIVFSSKNTERNNYIYFVYNGKIDLIKQIDRNNKKILVKLCHLEKYHFFGFNLLDSNSNAYFLASTLNDNNEINIIRIRKENFLSIKDNSNFFYSQLKQDYKESMPNQQEELCLYKEALLLRKLISKYK